MGNRIYDIFEKVRAEEELKRKTTNYLYAEMKKRKNRRRSYAVICCASLVLFLLCGGFGYRYFTPIAYIDIDINPSIELALNSFGRVIHTNAYNDDGEKLLREVNLRYADYNTAFEELLDALNVDGYFERDSLLCVTVQTDKGSREISIQKSLQDIIDIASQNHHYDFVSEIFSVTEEIKHSASENQISPAKYLAIQDLLKVDADADFEECKEHSVHELRQQAEEHCGCREEEHSREDENHSQGHCGNGYHH